jgi:hypothetical protein
MPVDPVPTSEILMTRIADAEEGGVQPPPSTPVPRAPRRCTRRDSDPTPLAEQFLANRPIDCNNPEVLAETICDLQGRLEVAMSQDEFRECTRCYRAVEAAKAHLTTTLKKLHQEEFTADIAQRTESATRDFTDFSREFDEREHELANNLQSQSDLLTQRSAEQRRQYEDTWRNTNHRRVRIFNRTSPVVRNLRVQQQYLLTSRRFDEAEQVCHLADERHEYETVEHHFQRFTEYAESHALLEKRQIDAEDTFRQASSGRRGHLQYEREKRERRFTKRFGNLQVEKERAKDPEKLWRICHRRDGDNIVNLTGRTRSPTVPVWRLKKADVKKFNTLSLPALPPARVGRKQRPRGSSAHFVIGP